jgi:erythronate-4-phosphate dehydrogenase
MYKIIADENIVFAKDAFSQFGEVNLFPGRELTNTLVKETDILIVRSITKVDQDLIGNSKIKFIGTATTGDDHIDKEYLKRKNIFFADAKGCNADSVTEYVFTALLKISSEKNISLQNKTIGVIGAGKIGSRVARLAEVLGMKVLINDPPLERSGKSGRYFTLNEVLKSDIITLHVTLTLSGEYKTFHLLNKNNLLSLGKNSILINTSRGEVIDSSALFEIAHSKKIRLILDVWENEPDINKELLRISDVGTSHIAGYSYEGKVNGTKMIFEALNKFTAADKKWNTDIPAIKDPVRHLSISSIREKNLYNLFKSIYNIDYDDSGLREVLKNDSESTGKQFDKLRKEYPFRREFNNFKVVLPKSNTNLIQLLQSFRFKIESI